VPGSLIIKSKTLLHQHLFSSSTTFSYCISLLHSPFPILPPSYIASSSTSKFIPFYSPPLARIVHPCGLIETIMFSCLTQTMPCTCCVIVPFVSIMPVLYWYSCLPAFSPTTIVPTGYR
jgi:hypothetical protein